MGATTFDKEQLNAIGAISLFEFATCLSLALAPARAASERTLAPLAQALLMSATLAALSELSHESKNRAVLIAATASGAGSALGHLISGLSTAQRRAHVEAAVLRVVRELTGAPTASLTTETPLMEAGVDSLAATELSSRLRSLTGVALSPTIVFEQPTPRAVAALLLEQASGITLEQRLQRSLPWETTIALSTNSGPVNLLPTSTTPETQYDLPNTDRARQLPGFSQGAPSPTLTTQIRVLFLHGNANCGALQRKLLMRSGWLSDPRFVFICPDAPHACQANISLYPRLHDAGLYGVDQTIYYSWGLDRQESTQQSERYLTQMLLDASPPYDAIGGICDGAILAAAIAALNPKGSLCFFLNACGGPMDRIAPYLVSHIKSYVPNAFPIRIPSLHLLSDEDEVRNMVRRSNTRVCLSSNMNTYCSLY